MPASSTATLTYALTAVSLDLGNQAAVFQFTMPINGVSQGTVPYALQAAALAAIMGIPGNLSRHDDLETAIYNSAVAAGVISGTVTLP